MPENAYRLAHLRSHASGVWSVPWPDPVRDLALRRHPGWPLCPAGCRYPVDPVAGGIHPGCEPIETTAGTEPGTNPRRRT